jgi:hypothetical protein
MDATSGRRQPKVFRGSARRIRRIRMRGNNSLQFWLLVAWFAFLILVVIPWMIRHSQ